MTLTKALQITRKILKENNLKGWSATTNRRKRSFGVCNYTKRQIELSQYLTPLCTDDAIMDTIYHEIAHALTPGHNHDRVWKRKAIELGGTGERTSGEWKYKDGEVKIETKYTLVCPVCGYKAPRSRRPKNKLSCGKHGPRFDPTYLLKVVQNY